MPKLSKHKALEVERRQATVGELACKGWSQQRIADELGISQTLVSRDIRECRKKWRQDLAYTVEESIAYEMAKLTNLERMAYEGYANSCRDTVTTNVEIEKAPRGSGKKGQAEAKAESVSGTTDSQAEPQGTLSLDQAIKVEKANLKIIRLLKKKSSKTNGAGDPRFLDLAFRCNTTRLEMLGAMGKDGFTFCLNQQINGELKQGLASLNWSALYKKQLVIETDDVEDRIKAMEDKATLVQSGVPVDESVDEIVERLKRDDIQKQLPQAGEQ